MGYLDEGMMSYLDEFANWNPYFVKFSKNQFGFLGY